MQNSRPILLILLVISLAYLSFVIYKTESKKRQIKEDLIELSNIKYGLFNMDEWKKILTDILTKKIEELEINSKNKAQMKKKVSDFLYKVLDDFEEKYYEANTQTFTGRLKNLGAKTFNVFGEMKKDVPAFTNQILDFLNNPQNQKALKRYLTSKLSNYADSTFARLNYTIHDSILNKYKFADRPTAIVSLSSEVNEFQHSSNTFKYMLVVLAFLTAAFIFLTKTINKIEFILLMAISSLFLILGLTLPMIEIDARVSEIKLSLLGEQINFQNQVLYYKSKSILEVVKLMITQSGFDLLVVGLLVFIFSVLFPISKLISSICLLFSPKLNSNKVVYFLVHKTGKWSMADVMVVAIFMSYIGFSGILTEQLHQLENISTKLEVLTTNKSSLQLGFFAFAAFTLLSLLTTNKLHTNLGSASENK